jgi:hypothetical protein
MANRAVAAWPDAVAGEKRIRASILGQGGWGTPATVGSSLDTLGYPRLRNAATELRWLDTSNTAHPKGFEARWLGDRWSGPRVIAVNRPERR